MGCNKCLKDILAGWCGGNGNIKWGKSIRDGGSVNAIERFECSEEQRKQEDWIKMIKR